jgi:hypothetical protein
MGIGNLPVPMGLWVQVLVGMGTRAMGSWRLWVADCDFDVTHEPIHGLVGHDTPEIC